MNATTNLVGRNLPDDLAMSLFGQDRLDQMWTESGKDHRAYAQLLSNRMVAALADLIGSQPVVEVTDTDEAGNEAVISESLPVGTALYPALALVTALRPVTGEELLRSMDQWGAAGFAVNHCSVNFLNYFLRERGTILSETDLRTAILYEARAACGKVAAGDAGEEGTKAAIACMDNIDALVHRAQKS